MKHGYIVTGTDKVGDTFRIVCDTYQEASKHCREEQQRGATGVSIRPATKRERNTPSMVIINEFGF